MSVINFNQRIKFDKSYVPLNTKLVAYLMHIISIFDCLGAVLGVIEKNDQGFQYIPFRFSKYLLNGRCGKND